MKKEKKKKKRERLFIWNSMKIFETEVKLFVCILGPMSDDIGIKNIIEILKKDKSRDVRSHFIAV